MERHDVLRTRLCLEEFCGPVQVVERGVALPVGGGRTGADLESERSRTSVSPELLEVDVQRGFDLARAPLMRLKLVRLGERGYRLVWSCHHALFDGWCLPAGLAGGPEPVSIARAGREQGSSSKRALTASSSAGSRAAGPRCGGERTGGSRWPGFASPTVPCEWVESVRAGKRSGERGAALRASEAKTRTLRAMGRRHGVTLNTLRARCVGGLLEPLRRRAGRRVRRAPCRAPAVAAGHRDMVGMFIEHAAASRGGRRRARRSWVGSGRSRRDRWSRASTNTARRQWSSSGAA